MVEYCTRKVDAYHLTKKRKLCLHFKYPNNIIKRVDYLE